MSISPRLARRWLGSVLLVLLAAATSNAHADDGILTWIVKSISSNEDGDIIPASALQVPQAGTALAAGQRISTSAGQHMVLTNGRDLVEVRPSTTLTIGDTDSTTPDANVDLVTGTIHVEVGKRAPGQTFSIGAPYLVATVKGTRFDVNTSSEVSAVSVTEGIVAVSSLASGESVDVTAGNTAIVRRGAIGAPSLAPTPAGGTPSSIGGGNNFESAGAKNGGDSAGSNSGGSNSGSSSAGGSSAGGSSSGSSSSGGSTSGGGGLGGAVGGAVGAVGGAVGSTTDKVGGAVSGASGAVGGAIGGSVGGAVSGVGGAVGGAVSGVGGAVGGAIGGVGKTAGGVLGNK